MDILKWFLRAIALLVLIRFVLIGSIMGAGWFNQPDNAFLDSEFRFLSLTSILTSYLLFRLSTTWRQEQDLLKVVVAVIFGGGLIRVYSLVAVGTPELPAMIATGLEVGLPFLVIGLMRRTA